MSTKENLLSPDQIINSVSGIGIADSSGNSITIQPTNLDYTSGDGGRETVSFNLSRKDRLLYELFLIQQNKAYTEEMRTEVGNAVHALSKFLKDIAEEVTPGADQQNPQISYELIDPATLKIYPVDPSFPGYDPEFDNYRQQVILLIQLRQQGQPVPTELQSYCDQAEVRFFAGPENERLRLDYMKQTVERYLRMPIVHLAVMRVIYTKEELGRIMAKPKKASKEKQAQVTARHYLKGGHLLDEQLKYTYPPDRKGQISIFDSLQDDTLEKIDKAGIERSTIIEGIKLSPSESKLVDSICKLLSIKSQSVDPEAKDYLTGNLEIETVKYSGQQKVAPKLFFTLYELVKEYNGGGEVSGRDALNVKAILEGLANKPFLISHEQKAKLPGGKEAKQKIEDFLPLFRILKITNTLSDNKGQEEYRSEKIGIRLNPIFIDQINNKFIKYPADLNRRTMIAYGSHNLSDASIRLRDYLMREKSSNHMKPEISLDRLYHLLCEKWMKEKRKKKVIEYTDRAIKTVTALGLITKHEVVPAKTTKGPKVIFYIDSEWC